MQGIWECSVRSGKKCGKCVFSIDVGFIALAISFEMDMKSDMNIN